MLEDYGFYLPLALALISLLISMIRTGPVAWARQQSKVVLWMGYLWAPMIILLIVIKLAGYW